MFYKNKYLIAVYDKKEDLCIFVCDNLEELNKFLRTKKQSIYSKISREQNNKCLIFEKYIVYLIDIKEKKFDIFNEEDIIFEKEFEDNVSIEEYCKIHNINIRTYFRRRLKGRLKGGKNGKQQTPKSM